MSGVRVHRVIARLNTGGPAMHVVHLTEDLADHGFDTRLIAGSITSDEGDMGYYAAERGVPVTAVSGMTRLLSPWGDLRALLQLYRLFRRERPTIVHTHTAKAGTLGRIAALLARVPVRIHTYHGHVLGGSYFSPAKTAFFRWIERRLAGVSHRLVVLTEDQRTEMATELALAPPERFAVIPLGLELERFAEVDRAVCRERIRGELGVRPDTVLVGMVGRMVPVKNHELFLDALADLRTEGLGAGVEGADAGDFRAAVIGSGERETELRARAARLGIEDGLHWMGWRDDLPELLPALDVLALTSHDEGTPVAILEALAARVPVVSRAVGGVSEILDRGRLGRLVESEDPEAFAAAVREVAADPPSPQLLEEGRRWALERFGRERLARDVAALYREELARTGP